jgi:hypothetical protein
MFSLGAGPLGGSRALDVGGRSGPIKCEPNGPRVNIS